jgi:hypothetical protein
MEGLKLKLRGKCIHVYRHRRNQTWKSKGGEREKKKNELVTGAQLPPHAALE